MHPNPAFRQTPRERNLRIARDRAFGTLAVSAPDGPLLSHVPFLLAPGADSVGLHLVRSNPIVRLLDTPQPAVISVLGPDAYISPDWYGVPDQVPTWNYVAVHLRGPLERRPQEEMRDLLDRQAATYEAMLHPKRPWTTGKMTPDALERMMRAIVPCRMALNSVDGTWKLSQNKEDAARESAATHVDAAAPGQETTLLATLMRAAGQE